MGAHQNFIAGEWVDGSSVTRDINPSNTNDLVGEYSQADAAQTNAAIEAAHAAFPAWSRTTPQERHDILLRVSTEILARREELGRLLSREEGKTLAEGIGEANRAGQIFDFFAGEVLRIPGEKFGSVRPNIDIEVTREPLRSRRHYRALELSARDPFMEDCASARLWQRGGVQARGSRSRMRPRAV